MVGGFPADAWSGGRSYRPRIFQPSAGDGHIPPTLATLHNARSAGSVRVSCPVQVTVTGALLHLCQPPTSDGYQTAHLARISWVLEETGMGAHWGALR